MKKGWEYKTLGEVSNTVNNINWNKDEHSYLYIELTSVDRETSSIKGTTFVDKTNAPSRAKQIVKKGDVLFATTRPTLKRVAIIDDDFDNSICSTGFCVIRPQVDIVVPRLIFYLLKNEHFYKYIEPLQTGASYPAVTNNIVKLYKFAIPIDISEQRRIVSYLDSSFDYIDKIKENASKALSEAKALFQSALAEAMEPKEGWEEKKLYDISIYSIGLTYKPNDVSEKGTIVLRSTNIQDDKLNFDDIVRVNTKIKDSLYVKNGDILMCSRNGSPRLVGKVAKIENISEPMTFGTFMMIIRSDYNDYLYYFFKSDCFRNQIKHGEANMINQITRYMLDDVIINLPSISEQEQIVSRLDSLSSKVRTIEEKYQKMIAECDALKQAMLREVFE